MLLAFGVILILWKLFFHYAYLFREILYGTEESAEDAENNDTSDEKDKNEDEEDPLHSIISVLGIIITIVACYPSIRAQNHIYNDCAEIYRLHLTDGSYKIYKQNGTEEVVYTRCEGGKTLVQQTDPEGGNKRLFFQRPMEEYINGFGS